MPSPRSGATDEGAGAGRDATAIITETGFSPEKGSSPVSARNAITASDQRSARRSTGVPVSCVCSGAM